MFEDGTFASPKFKSISAGGGLGNNELVYAIDSSDKLCKLYREQSTDGEWGYAFSGNIFDDEYNNPNSNNKPVEYQKGNFTSISCGNTHYCALSENGKLYMWGNFDRYMLGLYVVYNTSPVQIQIG